jgi:phage shock protein C
MNEEYRYKKLYRSRKERVIAGVCGGLADHFRIDPTWVRLIFVIFLLAGGAAFLAYVILWIIVPLEPANLDVTKQTKYNE